MSCLFLPLPLSILRIEMDFETLFKGNAYKLKYFEYILARNLATKKKKFFIQNAIALNKFVKRHELKVADREHQKLKPKSKNKLTFSHVFSKTREIGSDCKQSQTTTKHVHRLIVNEDSSSDAQTDNECHLDENCFNLLECVNVDNSYYINPTIRLDNDSDSESDNDENYFGNLALINESLND